MSSQIEDIARGEPRYYGLQMGTVEDNVDPEGLHRVQVRIPGIAEPATDWAWPITAGGGSPQRGGHVVPDKGADVAVWFHQGDPHGSCVYACGWWGIPAAGSEMPSAALDASADAHLVQVLQIGRVKFTVDERPGHRALRLEDSEGAGSIEVDLERKGVVIDALAGLVLRSVGAVVIDALSVVINGRSVATTSDHI